LHAQVTDRNSQGKIPGRGKGLAQFLHGRTLIDHHSGEVGRQSPADHPYINRGCGGEGSRIVGRGLSECDEAGPLDQQPLTLRDYKPELAVLRKRYSQNLPPAEDHFFDVVPGRNVDVRAAGDQQPVMDRRNLDRCV
jgi:hypothetical protein